MERTLVIARRDAKSRIDSRRILSHYDKEMGVREDIIRGEGRFREDFEPECETNGKTGVVKQPSVA